MDGVSLATATLTTDTLGTIASPWDRWIEKIAPWIGATNIYISPFGVSWKNNDPLYRYIVDSGYQIFCPVGNGRIIKENSDNIIMPRVNLDGYTMNKRPVEMKEYYFDVKDVIDPKRPPLQL